MMPTPLTAWAIRLRPGEDLRDTLFQLAKTRPISAGCILTAVGSLSRVALRYANRAEAQLQVGDFEIVSLVGTLDAGGGHLHLTVADANGVTTGGHLMPGCTVRTTAEIVIGELTQIAFERAFDPASGYRELMVMPRQGSRE